MYRLLIFLSLVILISCKRKEKQHDLSLQRTKIERVFSSIEKEKAFLINYQFNKLELSDGIVVFKYYDNDSNNFVVSCASIIVSPNGSLFNIGLLPIAAYGLWKSVGLGSICSHLPI